MTTPNPGIIPAFKAEIRKKRNRASHACVFYRESKNLPRNYSAHVNFYLIYEEEPGGHPLLQQIPEKQLFLDVESRKKKVGKMARGLAKVTIILSNSFNPSLFFVQALGLIFSMVSGGATTMLCTGV